MKQFRNSDHFASWAGLVPGCNESAGKKKSSRIRKGNLFLKSTLVECAHSAIRHKDSYFYAKYCKISARRGGKRAIVAIAHSMALAIYHMLLNREHFYDLGSDYFNTIYAEKIKKRNIQSLGSTENSGAGHLTTQVNIRKALELFSTENGSFVFCRTGKTRS